MKMTVNILSFIVLSFGAPCFSQQKPPSSVPTNTHGHVRGPLSIPQKSKIHRTPDIADLLKQADNYRLGISLHDEAKAAELYRQAAELGSAEGQTRYGESLFDGRGVARNRTLARESFEKAAAQNYARAEANLGVMATKGLEVPIDRQKGLAWLQRAADHGDAYAEDCLGQFAEHGWVEEQSNAESLMHYLNAAAKGSPYAEYNVGRFYLYGIGVEKDTKQAMKWFLQAASTNSAELRSQWSEIREEAGGIDEAIFEIGHIYDSGDGVRQDKQEARKWFQRGAEFEHAAALAGWPLAETLYGNNFLDGTGTVKDYAQAMSWYLKAADQGYAVAQYNIGNLYRLGAGVPQDYGKAFEWYRKAADQELPEAQCQIGVLYQDGNGVSRDYFQAVTWFYKAASQGFAPAQIWIGHSFRDGHGVRQDYVEAASWYRKAAVDPSITVATNNLASLYFEGGHGLDRDDAEALRWLRSSAINGDAWAQTSLGWLYVHGASGVSTSPKEGMIWFQKAADKGFRGGEYGMGYLYAMGLGVSKDTNMARFWLKRAADQGMTQAKEGLAALDKQDEQSATQSAPAAVNPVNESTQNPPSKWESILTGISQAGSAVSDAMQQQAAHKEAQSQSSQRFGDFAVQACLARKRALSDEFDQLDAQAKSCDASENAKDGPTMATYRGHCRIAYPFPQVATGCGKPPLWPDTIGIQCDACKVIHIQAYCANVEENTLDCTSPPRTAR